MVGDYVELQLEMPMTITRELVYSAKIGGLSVGGGLSAAAAQSAKHVAKLVAFSAAVAEDASLARQLRRKFLCA